MAVLTGWGLTPKISTIVSEPGASEIPDVVKGSTTVTPRGLGRGYGDCAVSSRGVTLLTSRLDRIDEIVGDTVVVEAGVSLARLLARIIPEGFFVPVTPGTRFVTIGGAIAADIHGKNHHRDGSFGQHLEWLEILGADGRIIRATPHEHHELFWATIGGMGLTGLIIRAAVKLLRIETSQISVLTTRHKNLDALMQAMMDRDTTHRYTVAWVDTLASGRSHGRSVLWAGDHALRADLSHRASRHPLRYEVGQRLRIPSAIPISAVRASTVRVFNEVWFRRAHRRPTHSTESIAKFFHPLDGVGSWNHLYGPRGFVQYQFVVPDRHSELVGNFLQTLSTRRVPAFLSVLKRFGARSQGWLSFPSPGWTLAVDIPASSEGLARLLDAFDEQVVHAGGRVYLAKDARLRPSLMKKMYPRLAEFQSLRRTIDPERQFSSHLATRLGL